MGFSKVYHSAYLCITFSFMKVALIPHRWPLEALLLSSISRRGGIRQVAEMRETHLFQGCSGCPLASEVSSAQTPVSEC